jgi:hypothetical protein
VGEVRGAEAAFHDLARSSADAGVGDLLALLFPTAPVPARELERRRGRYCHQLGPRPGGAIPAPVRVLDLEFEGGTWRPGGRAWVRLQVVSPEVEGLWLFRQDGVAAHHSLARGLSRLALPVADLAAGREPRVTLVARLAGGRAAPLGTILVDGPDWRAREVEVTGPPRRTSEARHYRLDAWVARPRGGYPRFRWFRDPSRYRPGGPVVLARDADDGRFLGQGTVLREGSARLDLALSGLALGATARVDLQGLGADGILGPVTTVHLVGE